MADKLEGTAIIANTVSGDRIVAGSITSTQLTPSIATAVATPLLKIRTITYPGNDTAANTGGGDTIVLTGTGFGQNVQVYINSNAVPSVTYANANSISFTAPALAAATYPVYVINTDDGATAILIPGIQYSGTPTWTTTTPLTTQDASIAWNIQLIATSDSAVSYSLQAGSSLPDGITLAANGLISGTMTSPPEDETTYNFTVVANDLEQQDSSRAFSVSVTVAVLDPFFTYTTLLLHGDGTNNANNHAFVDSSNNNFAITRNGNATQGTFSPFGDNWSYYFDGDADEVNAGYNSNFTFGSGNFTIECWVYTQATGIIASIWDDFSTSPQSWIIPSGSRGSTTGSDLRFVIDVAGSDTLILQSNVNQPMNQWFHLAITRNGNNWYMFFDGVQVATASSSATISAGNGTRPLTIGAGGAGANQSHRYGMNGYISNFRIIKGNALYTSNFTPPTQPLEVVANTTLLTCQSNRFVDEGPNRYSITPVNNTRVTKFDPFKPYKAIPASYGVYFDGSGDYLKTPSSSVFNWSGANFTVEGWFYATSPASSQHIFASYIDTNNRESLYFSNGTTLNWWVNGSTRISTTVAANTWYHFAIVNNSGTTTFYINGSSVGTWSSTYTNGNRLCWIATYNDANYAPDSFAGHISNFRIVNGAAVYTSNFTPPTSPLTAVANTQLLTCQSTTIIDNSTNAFTITRNGDARPTDFNPFTTTFVSEKYNTANGGGSLYIDGTGDFLNFTGASATTTQDLTLEFWVYANASLASSNYGLLALSDARFGIITVTGTLYVILSPTDINTGAALSIQQWNHIRLTRTSNTIRIFLNGIQVGSISNSQAVSGNWRIGSNQSGEIFPSAYISGLRILIGTGGTSNFVPPDAPPTNIANTAALLNFTNAGILDSVGKVVLETAGSAKVSTSVKKYGSGSIDLYTNTNADYLTLKSSDVADLGAGDFTVEFWMYPQTLTTSYSADSYATIFDADSGAGAATTQWWVVHQANQGIYWGTNNGTVAGVTGSVLTAANAWYHVAISRSSGVVRTFVNGNLANTVSYSTAIGAQNRTLHMGKQLSSGRYFKGYLDDVRITKGVGRYRYNFTPPTKAFNDGDGNLATPTSDVLPGDQVNTPVFPYTTLLLHGDGTNNANNHAFVDSSNNNFAITRNGNATQGTFSPFSPTGWSTYFSSSYLTAGTTASNFLCTGSATGIAATFEAWVYPTAYNTGASDWMFSPVHAKNGTYFNFGVRNGAVRFYWFDGGYKNVTSASTNDVPLNTWTHIAVTISGSTIKIYVNGLLNTTSATYTGVASAGAGTAELLGVEASGTTYFSGYISNYRLTNTVVYSAAFTPSTTPLTAISGTQLLVNQSNRFIDNSPNAFAITVTGSPLVQTFSPFAPSVEYTANTHGGSAYFDGTGDSLTFTDSSNVLDLGNMNASVEFWFYAPSVYFGQTGIGIFNKSGGTDSWSTSNGYEYNFYIFDGSLWFYYNNAGSAGTNIYGSVVANQWTHVALATNSSNTISLYINGSRVSTATNAITKPTTRTTMRIGNTAVNEFFSGYISGLRFISGIGAYDASQTTITVPTLPVAVVANTQLLTNFTNAGILDSTGKLILETVGDVKVNTAIKKFGTGSIAFDGSGDRLTIPFTNDFLELGINGQNFTVEAWIYPTNAMASAGQILSKGGGVASWSTTNGAQYQWGISSSAAYWSWNSSGSALQITNGNVTLNTWQHLAVTYDGTTTRTFLNGVLQATSTSPYTAPTTRNLQYIGMTQSGGFTQEYFGYIDDLRITKGIARYVTNFTPPTAAFLNK